MYCPECGCKIEDADALFCPECGTRVREESQQTDGKTPVVASRDSDDCVGVLIESLLKEGAKLLFNEGVKLFSGKKNKQSIYERKEDDSSVGWMYGIVFTNVRMLATKLGTTEEMMRNLLDAFIEQKRKFGVSYQLVDVGCYTFKQGGTTVQLDSGCGLWEYMEILMDIHDYELKYSLPVSEFLFIIGGDDIIPTGRIRHYMADDLKFRDRDIETDILYEYPYGREMVGMLENQQLFNYDQLFYVGRLPMGMDTSLNDFVDYLKRDIAHSEGIPMREAYIQSDPNWKRMSATAASTLVEGRWLKNLDGRLVDGCYFNGIILSPLVVSENLHQVFNKEASVFFFNLHGSNAEGMRGYFGNYCPQVPQKSCASVVLPEHLRTCGNPNLVYSGACYGARYINKDKNHSMVLSSLYGKTLLFVGASRMAFGGNEPQNAAQLYVPISFGDVLAKGFWDSLMSGNVVGKALFDGRSAAFKVQPGHPIYATTIVEFNVYGDPTLRMNVSACSRSVDVPDAEAVGRIAETKDYGCITEVVELPSTSSSILDMVRRKVDDNISRIHDMIGHHLYEAFGLEPRPASSIFRLRYADGSRVLTFNYDVDAGLDMPVRYMVETTEKGDILNFITTK